MDTIKIELVNVDGKLVGRTASDRWNLAQYGVRSLAADRNQTAVKRLRRVMAADGLTVQVVRGAAYVADLSGPEWDAFQTAKRPAWVTFAFGIGRSIRIAA